MKAAGSERCVDTGGKETGGNQGSILPFIL
jgi:hypothetical protein